MMVTLRSETTMPAGRGRSAGSDPGIGQAPGDLGRIQAFVNTLDVEQGTDDLATPAALESWLRQAGLTKDLGRPATPSDLARAVELREAFRAVLGSHVTHAARGRQSADARPPAQGPPAEGPPAHDPPAHDPPAHDPPARIAEIAATMPAAIQADADGAIRLVPAESGIEAGLTWLLLIAAEAATLGMWPRLKVCSADDCQWAFYDRSPTRNGCWCSMQICGSRAKSRAYRSRAAPAR
jgi:predicted RNA-binding Zn ribbon-like protein